MRGKFRKFPLGPVFEIFLEGLPTTYKNKNQKKKHPRETSNKTQSDIRNFKAFLLSDDDDREIKNIPDQHLDILIY